MSTTRLSQIKMGAAASVALTVVLTGCAGSSSASPDKRSYQAGYEDGSRGLALQLVKQGVSVKMSCNQAVIAIEVGNPSPYNDTDWQQGCADALKKAGYR